jgi:hypothetical protein
LTDGRFRLPVLVVFMAIVAGAASFLAPQSSATRAKREKSGRIQKIDKAEGARLLRKIGDWRRKTWHWQELMGRPHTPHSGDPPPSLAYRRWVLHLWTQRELHTRRQAFHPPHLAAWLCIHRYEGSWTDPNPPYFGGLQMDLGFQRTYAPELVDRKGTADKWSPLEQIWVAERAYQSGRGFYPWPNTARYCGLL